MNKEIERQLEREGGVPIEIKPDWKRAIEVGAEVTKFWKEHYPFEIEVTLRPEAEYPNRPQLHYFDSDWHLGAIGFSGEKFKNEIEVLEKTPNSFLHTVGDDIDIGLFKDLAHLQAIPRYSQALAMRSLAIELSRFNPREKQIWLTATGGNHTFTVFERIGFLYEDFLLDTNLALFPGMGKLHLQVGSQEYQVALAHKHMGRSKLNLTLAAKRLMEYYMPTADISVVGHYHEKAIEEFYRGGQEKTAIALGTRRTQEQIFELSRGYGQTSEGGVAVVLFPNEHKVLPFRELKDAIKHL